MFKQAITFAEYLDLWLEKIVKESVRYNTYTSYKGYINNHIKKFLGSYSLVLLKPANIQEFVSQLVDSTAICARTIGLIVGMIGNALSYAEDYELIIKNPCRRIRLPKVEASEVAIFNNDEQTLIERAVLASQDKRAYAILLALYTGLRIGEVCALRWENVDFANYCIYIKKSINRIAQNKDCKTKTIWAECEPKTKKSNRTIQLPKFILKILQQLKATSSSPYVFSMKNGSFVQPRTMQAIHKRVLKKAGVDYKNFHVLRHTFATRAGANGDVKTVSDTLGHSNVMITLNRYMHSQQEQKQRMMEGLNKYFKDKKLMI